MEALERATGGDLDRRRRLTRSKRRRRRGDLLLTGGHFELNRRRDSSSGNRAIFGDDSGLIRRVSVLYGTRLEYAVAIREERVVSL